MCGTCCYNMSWDYKRGHLSSNGELLAPLTLLSTPVEVRRRCWSSWWFYTWLKLFLVDLESVAFSGVFLTDVDSGQPHRLIYSWPTIKTIWRPLSVVDKGGFDRGSSQWLEP